MTVYWFIKRGFKCLEITSLVNAVVVVVAVNNLGLLTKVLCWQL